MVSVGLRGGGEEVIGLAFARAGRNFTVDEVELLATLQPLLQAIDRHARRMASWQARLANNSGPAATVAAREVGLTGREVDVLLMLAEGLTAAAAARRLGCSPRTVQKHVGNLYRKLSVRDRLQAVLEAQQRGLLPPTDWVGSVSRGTAARQRQK
jgi:DNA-binding NarL/FixJ family response regulator